jgi:hypothetical protein
MALGTALPKAEVDRFNLGWSRGLTLTARILAVNLFALVLMATGLFFLDSYRTRLVAERQLAAEAQVRLLAASLPLVDSAEAEALIAQSARNGKMRVRIYNADGGKSYDSFASIGPTYRLNDPAKEPWRKTAARWMDRAFDFVVGAPDLQYFSEPSGDIAGKWPELAAISDRPSVSQVRFATDLSHVITAAAPLPTTGQIAQDVLGYRGEGEVAVSVWQTFAGDPDEEYARKFSGRVVSVQPGLLTVRLLCEESFTSMARSSAAQVMQRPCRHAHYFTYADGGGCRLDVNAWKQAVVITAATGRVMTIPLAGLQPDGTFSAGLLFLGSNQYFIENHTGNQITLESVPVGLAVPANVDIAPGCNLTPQNCVAFNNIANFGGFWFMTDTPFDGRALG